jgi:hypothetical protein
VKQDLFSKSLWKWEILCLKLKKTVWIVGEPGENSSTNLVVCYLGSTYFRPTKIVQTKLSRLIHREKKLSQHEPF